MTDKEKAKELQLSKLKDELKSLRDIRKQYFVEAGQIMDLLADTPIDEEWRKIQEKFFGLLEEANALRPYIQSKVCEIRLLQPQ